MPRTQVRGIPASCLPSGAKRHGLQWVRAQRAHKTAPFNRPHEQPDHHRDRPPPSGQEPPPRRPVTRRAVLGRALGLIVAAGRGAGGPSTATCSTTCRSPTPRPSKAANASVVEADASGTATADRPTRSDTAKISITKVQTGTGTDTVTYFVADVDAHRRDRRCARRSRTTSSARTSSPNTSEIAAGDDAVLRDQRRLLRLPRHRHRDPQRRGLPRRRRPAGPGVLHRRHVALYDETATTADELLDAGVWNTLSFGPAWSRTARSSPASTTSRSTPTSATTRSRATSRAPAVGMIDANHLLFVVVDGRSTGYSRGRHDDRARPDLHGPRRHRSPTTSTAAAPRRWCFNGELVNNPLGQRQGARHQRHPLHGAAEAAVMIVLIPAYEPDDRLRRRWSTLAAAAPRSAGGRRRQRARVRRRSSSRPRPWAPR